MTTTRRDFSIGRWFELFYATFLARLKAVVVAIGLSGMRGGFEFAERMFREFPELREA